MCKQLDCLPLVTFHLPSDILTPAARYRNLLHGMQAHKMTAKSFVQICFTNKTFKPLTGYLGKRLLTFLTCKILIEESQNKRQTTAIPILWCIVRLLGWLLLSHVGYLWKTKRSKIKHLSSILHLFLLALTVCVCTERERKRERA